MAESESIAVPVDENVRAALADTLRHRRTINFFDTAKPPVADIERAIELACWAPNHHLTEPWHFYHLSEETKQVVVDINTSIVQDKKGADAAAKKHERWSAIPGWVVVTCDRSDDELLFMEDHAAVSCAIHSMCLYLWSCGIGTKWTSGPVTRDPRLYDAIWADPEREVVVGLVWYGYAKEIPLTSRKPIDQVLINV